MIRNKVKNYLHSALMNSVYKGNKFVFCSEFRIYLVVVYGIVAMHVFSGAGTLKNRAEPDCVTADVVLYVIKLLFNTFKVTDSITVRIIKGFYPDVVER